MDIAAYVNGLKTLAHQFSVSVFIFILCLSLVHCITSLCVAEFIIHSSTLWLVERLPICLVFPSTHESRSHVPHIIYDKIKLLTTSSDDNEPHDTLQSLHCRLFDLLSPIKKSLSVDRLLRLKCIFISPACAVAALTRWLYLCPAVCVFVRQSVTDGITSSGLCRGARAQQHSCSCEMTPCHATRGGPVFIERLVSHHCEWFCVRNFPNELELLHRLN